MKIIFCCLGGLFIATSAAFIDSEAGPLYIFLTLIFGVMSLIEGLKE